MEVKKVLDQIVYDEKVVSEDIGGWDSKTATGKQMAKRMAEDRLVTLREQYKSAVFAAAHAIIMDGSPDLQSEWAAIAEDEAETITVDANETYLEIARKVYPTIGRDQLFTTTQSAKMFETIEEMAVRNDIPSTVTYPIGTPVASVVKNEQECANLIRDVIRKSIGDTFSKYVLEKQVVERALSIRYNSNVVPVVVVNASPEEVVGLEKALFTGRNYPVKLSGAITKEVVLKTLRQVKKSIQSNTQS